MMNDLGDIKRKLSFLKQKSKDENPAFHAPKEKPVEFNLSGWEKQGDFSYVYTHQEAVPQLSELLKNSLIFNQAVQADDLFFFDTETTGLSGGAGNRIFLFALGCFKKNVLEVKQFFMTDYPGEMEFLDLVLSHLSENKIYVSYNGKTFDSYLFKSRLDLYSRPFPIKDQLDLLHWARRFWKRQIGSCRLSQIEERVLNITREQDIPGYEVPAAYFDFLRSGNLDQLALVFHHNLQDVLSLALLLHQLLILTQKENKKHSITDTSSLTIQIPADPSALSRFFQKNDPEKASRILEQAYGQGDFRSGAILARNYKKQKDYARSYEIWEQLFSQRPSPYYAIELAKLSEHQFRDYQNALEWIDKGFKAQSFILPVIREDLRKRRERLVKKSAIRELKYP
ncbi:MAG: ribonuclease H-like domain-containing protein [Spirochaetales bacterium]|nr:ribonuclease H-like domain-containing protein [Spirochaetales bacterium]